MVYFSIIIFKSWDVLLSFSIYSGIITPQFFRKNFSFQEMHPLLRCGIVRKTDGQGYDADGHRYNLFDDHEDNHRQEIAAKY